MKALPRKYSLAQLTVLHWSPPEMIYNARLIGYDAVGIRPIVMGVKGEHDFDLAKNKELFKLTEQAIQETGVVVNDIELARIADGIDVGRYESSFETAAKLGVKDVLSSIWTDKKDFYLEQFAKLCGLAGQYGLFVNLEFVTWAGVKNLKGARDVLDAVKKPNAAIFVDTLHFHRSRVTLEELDACSKDLFRFMHICDGPKEIPDESSPTCKEDLIHVGRDAREYVGEGAIDIAGIVKRLPDGILFSVELPHLEKAAKWGPVEHARRCLATAKEYMKKHGID
ncbi:MAG: sugar phosphate isomerase/epimerase [Synergistaceae bacterium]|nr:sugar phosphate isomerase/epimerase [Synergistaceae bacterium]